MTRILQDIALDDAATSTQTGTICEPSLAVSGKRMMITGNWFASRSRNGGADWSFVDPFSELPSTGPGVCCDQLVLYSKSHRLWIWLLQFQKTASGNIFRVAVSSTGASGSWVWWDTMPTDIDANWNNLWFDYPDKLETENHILFSFNLFNTSNDHWQRAAVIRFSLDELKHRGAVTRQGWSTDEVGSLRFAKGSTDTAIFASQSAVNPELMVFEWPDLQPTVSEFSVPVTDWSESNYRSNGPGGTPWLERLDGRITGGWRSNGVIGFAWCAAADSQHPHPYIRVARINETTGDLIDEPDLWSSECAWAYPATAPNQRGDVGITAFCGGPNNHPAHSVGWFDESQSGWEMTTGAISTHGPHNGAWGDYLDIQADPSRKTYWVASGYILNGGSNRRNVEPRVVVFKP